MLELKRVCRPSTSAASGRFLAGRARRADGRILGLVASSGVTSSPRTSSFRNFLKCLMIATLICGTVNPLTGTSP